MEVELFARGTVRGIRAFDSETVKAQSHRRAEVWVAIVCREGAITASRMLENAASAPHDPWSRWVRL